MTVRKPGGLLSLALVLVAGSFFVSNVWGQGNVTLRASHQWPQGDIRDEMVRIIADEVENADVGLSVRVYPGASLMGPREQWDAIVKGQLDITAFPLDYASGRHAQFSSTLMPGLVKSYDHAQRIDESPFMDSIHEIINDAGVVVLADTWLSGGFASSQQCILEPDDVDGQVTRAAGPYFERMLAAAGASIVSMPSSEAYTALQTGVLDGLNTSSASFLSYRIFEVVDCLTPAGDNALWFMYEPILMSQRSFDRLNEEQQQALLDAGEKAREFAYAGVGELEQEFVSAFEDAGVEIAYMDEDQWQQWIDIAEETAYEEFAENVEGGAELLEQARAVE